MNAMRNVLPYIFVIPNSKPAPFYISVVLCCVHGLKVYASVL